LNKKFEVPPSFYPPKERNFFKPNEIIDLTKKTKNFLLLLSKKSTRIVETHYPKKILKVKQCFLETHHKAARIPSRQLICLSLKNKKL